MEREVSREKILPSFAITIDELEILFNRLVDLFDSSEAVYSSITIEFTSEQFKFKNIEELKQHSLFRGKVRHFSIHLSKDNKRVSIRNISRIIAFGTHTKVYATADNEAWCAGAIETVYTFMQMHKVWFHWLAVAPISLGYIIICIGTIILQISFPNLIIFKFSGIYWVIILLIFMFLSYAQPRVFPSSSIIFIQEQNFIQRYNAELGWLTAVIAILISLLQWYFAK